MYFVGVHNRILLIIVKFLEGEVKMSNSDTRESKFELLRIVSLFLVITTHVVSKWWWNIGYVHYNWHLSVLIGSFARVAVGCFIMISGYFMYNRPFNLKKRVRQILLFFVLLSNFYTN